MPLPVVATTSLDAAGIEIKEVDHLAVLGLLWDQLGFTEVLNRSIPADEQVAVSPGLIIKAMVLNAVGGRDPLYRVAESYRFAPVEAVVGSGVRMENLNDAALARHLDRLFEAGGEGVFNALSLRAIEREGLTTEKLHLDTTSRLVFGAYVHEEEDAISITYGHSKDHRPDLKQVMMGLGVTSDGVPVTAQMLSGNTSDKTWHRGMLEVVRSQLQVTKERPLHYVGDSALITTENLKTAAAHGIHLTGRLPRTVGACDDVVRESINTTDGWHDLGAFSDEPHATRYAGRLVQREVLGHQVWLGVYRTGEIVDRVKHNVTRRQQKEAAQAVKKAALLMKRTFACVPDAEAELQTFSQSKKDALISITGCVESEAVTLPRRPGRPKKGESAPTEQVHRLRIEVVPDDKAAEKAMIEESCFVVLTTRPIISSARQLLADYKGQVVVETRFPFLKDPAWADVFFIKKPHRLEALGYVILISLLLWSLWERRVRANLRSSGEAPLVDTTGMKKKNPTAKVCRHIMQGIKLFRLIGDHGATPWRLAAPLTAEQERVFRFSGTPTNAFLAASNENHLLAPSPG